MNDILDVMLADDRRSWLLQPDGHWIRTEVAQSRPGTIETFAVLKEDAVAAVAVATESGEHVPSGSLDPRA